MSRLKIVIYGNLLWLFLYEYDYSNGYDTNCLLEKFQHLYFKLAH